MTFEEEQEFLILNALYNQRDESLKYLEIKKVFENVVSDNAGSLLSEMIKKNLILKKEIFYKDEDSRSNTQYPNNVYNAYVISSYGNDKYLALKKEKRKKRRFRLVANATLIIATVASIFSIMDYYRNSDKAQKKTKNGRSSSARNTNTTNAA